MRPLHLGIALLVLAAAGSSPVAAAERPNIIFILADDIGLPGFGCTGGIFKTPNIDALAAGGVRFASCYAAPLCGPSRAMLMTGRYAFRTGVTNNGTGAAAHPDKDGCVAKVLKSAGYTTGVAGKWRQLSHLTNRADGARWGFDEFLIWGNPADDDDEAGKGKGSRYWDPNYNLNGKTLEESEGKYGPDVLQAFALDFIRRHKDGPFFLYYPTPLIHAPILPTPDSPKGQADAKARRKEKRNQTSTTGLYAQNIAYLDKQVGQLVAELDKLGIRRNTLIVFTGDNGSVGGGGLVNGKPVDGGKHTMLEGGSRVPLIANWPGTTPSGVVLKDLTDFTDLLPTFAEVAGARLPEGRKVDGRSFAPQLHGEKGRPREWAYVQLGAEWYIRDPRWKYTQAGELFDMAAAPFEQVLVPPDSPDPEAKPARQRLKAALDDLRSSEPAPAVPRKQRKKARTP